MENAVLQRAIERKPENQATKIERVKAWLVVVTSALAVSLLKSSVQEAFTWEPRSKTSQPSWNWISGFVLISV